MSSSNFVKIRSFPTPNAMSLNPLTSDLGLGLGLVENFGCTLPEGATGATGANVTNPNETYVPYLYFVTNGTSADLVLDKGSNYNDVGAQFVVPNILGSITSVILNTNSNSNLPISNSFVNLIVTTLGVVKPVVYSFPYNNTMSYPFVYNLTNSTSLPIKLQTGQIVTASYSSPSPGINGNTPTMISLYIE